MRNSKLECCKGRGIRAREVAQKRFLANDFSAARKFAKKAQFLFPELDGISQMVSTFSVHLSAQNIIHGEIDYCGVLGINPEADYETVRKRYRKLAMMLHPDKNKSVGGEEAFKLLSQAWGMFSGKTKRASSLSSKPASNGSQKVTKATTEVKSTTKGGVKRASDADASASASTVVHKPTSDTSGSGSAAAAALTNAATSKAKRPEYDLKWNPGLYEGGGASSSSKPASNGSQKVTKATTKAKSTTKIDVKRASNVCAPAASAATSTVVHKPTYDGFFWTVCRTCRIRYEYHHVYLNQKIRCPNCREPFRAVETDIPVPGSIRKPFHEHQFDSSRQTTDARKTSRGESNESSEWSDVYTGTITPTHAPQTGLQKEEVAVRREFTKRAAAGGAPATNPTKRRKCMEDSAAGSNTNTLKEFTRDEVKNLLKKKAKPIISRKLQELCSKPELRQTDWKVMRPKVKKHSVHPKVVDSSTQ
ncbi:unnamed protein product [Thlaspi arvense]|uniref:J domain-containing protein n=1 Tax=Thlaspi arvense TaxID=13288 RepID=A0AAU9SBK5_THLAR|nr:unnamed protein product [Thlaspi arvense]